MLNSVNLVGLDYTFRRKKCLSGIWALPVGTHSPVRSRVSFSEGRCPGRPLSNILSPNSALDLSDNIDNFSQHVTFEFKAPEKLSLKRQLCL